jgi:hypothetical protein
MLLVENVLGDQAHVQRLPQLLHLAQALADWSLELGEALLEDVVLPCPAGHS